LTTSALSICYPRDKLWQKLASLFKKTNYHGGKVSDSSIHKSKTVAVLTTERLQIHDSTIMYPLQSLALCGNALIFHRNPRHLDESSQLPYLAIIVSALLG
jgi:hypothetical protein